jgi:hypothetical protein
MVNATMPKMSRQPQSFRCTLECGRNLYALTPILGVHPEGARAAFRLRERTGDGAVYDVRMAPDGAVECDCRGFTRWGHCKHASMLTVLGCIPAADGSASPEPQCPPETPVERPVVRPAAKAPETEPLSGLRTAHDHRHDPDQQPEPEEDYEDYGANSRVTDPTPAELD